MRFLTALFAFSLICFSATNAAELNSREKQIVSAIESTINRAQSEYQSQKLDASVNSLKRAIEQIQVGLKVGSADLFDSLEPQMKRITTIHAMLELEGVSVPPFHRPERPSPKVPEGAAMTEKPAVPGAPPSKESFFATVGFSTHVAPILVGKCGRCHVTGNKGDFNMANYNALMKGSKAGVVIFPGDANGSALIEEIESGAMPPNGSLTPQELITLKTWINTGAKFDGADPNATLTSAVAPAAAPMQEAAVETKAPTGKETVSFAGDIAPLLVGSCKGCHIEAMQARGGLTLDNFARLLRGGDSGAIIVPGNAEESLLVKKLKGLVGDRMPAGGKPAFTDQQIQLVSTWINEGAVLDGASKDQPIEIMSKLAWMSRASSSDVSAKRAENAVANLKFVRPGGEASSVTTPHFYITGTAPKATMELVGKKAEEQMKWAKSIVEAGEGEEYFRGRATIFVMPRRYDYNEFAKMIERRDLPANWNSHWMFDGISAYVAVIATDRDTDEEIGQSLVAPIVSLAVATRGMDVPRWFSEGVGASVAASSGKKIDRNQKKQRDAEIYTAVAAMTDAKQFLDQKLKPEYADRISAAIVDSMMDGSRRSNFNALIRNISDGLAFEPAFQTAFKTTPMAYITTWKKWATGN